MAPTRPLLSEGRAPARPSASAGRRWALAAAACACAAAGQAHGAIGQLSKLSDVSFASLSPLTGASARQDVCASSGSSGRVYSIRATGSGAGGAFLLSAGGGLTLAYGVQWASSAGASTGTAMAAGVDLEGQTSTATSASCLLGPSTTASLIVTLAASDLQAATAGVTYTGSLTLILAPQ